ncbi:LysR family transcriptional regulator [Aureimonas sp. AU40]|uniref:LysR family transcriptional regulator n=1 Tax=Aureimonas sp. AU40 TaxID=1637747 RepID=UPI0007824FF2|nr:LysR family transcriptional regulator [Aureimonas sp. AU40]
MQIRHLQYFVTLARVGHFRRAAESCGVSQPTLSAGLNSLETLLGVELVRRDRRFVGLTAEGEAALPWAQQMLHDCDGMLRAAGRPGIGLSGRLRLGVIPAAMPAAGAIPPVLAIDHPDLQPVILSMTSREIERALHAHDIDGGITYLESEPLSGVISWTFYEERYRFATPADGEFAGRSSISWAEAASAPLCLLTRDMQNRRILDAQMTRVGVEMRPRATTNSYTALLSMVRMGGLSSILPHPQARTAERDPSILVLPFDDPSPPQAVGLVVLDRHPMSALTRAILSCVRSAEFRRRIEPLRDTR